MSILTIRDFGELDDALYPSPTADGNGIALSADDGSNPVNFPIQGLRLSVLTKGDTWALTDLVRIDDASGSGVITDARVAIVSRKYDTGSRWFGGITALALDAGSRAIARYRTRGTCLVGQVRYAWLAGVGGSAKAGWRDYESLRIQLNATVDGTLRRLYLDLILKPETRSTELARVIANRAASYRLAAGDAEGPDELAQLRQLAEARAIPSQKGKYASHTFPGSYPFSQSTANLHEFIARRGSGGDT